MCDITSASAYIHNKHHLTLTSDWLWYEYYIECAHLIVQLLLSQLTDQLEILILNCEFCLKYSQSKCKQEPSMPLGQEVPLHPWSKLVMDLFHF